MNMTLIMSVIFIIRFPVVGGLRARDAEIFVRVNFLQQPHKKTHNHTFIMSVQLIPMINCVCSLTLQYDMPPVGKGHGA